VAENLTAEEARSSIRAAFAGSARGAVLNRLSSSPFLPFGSSASSAESAALTPAFVAGKRVFAFLPWHLAPFAYHIRECHRFFEVFLRFPPIHSLKMCS
jgi:hypothetical protein